MSDVIFFDGAKYISASDAASQAAVSRDYIAHLCKQEKILGRKIGKQWYVSQSALESFVLAQNSQREAQRQELAKIRALEYRVKSMESRLEGVPAPSGDAHVRHTFRSAVANIPSDSAASVARAVASAPMHAAALAKHGSVQAAPLLNAVHKILAGVVAVLFIIGTYAFVDAQYGQMAERAQHIGSASARSLSEQLAAAAENPSGAVSEIFAAFARAFNRSVDSIVYGTMFPGGATSSSKTEVVERVSIPDLLATSRSVPQPSSGGGSTSLAQQNGGTPTRIVERVYLEPVERVIETRRIISTGGGITGK